MCREIKLYISNSVIGREGILTFILSGDNSFRPAEITDLKKPCNNQKDNDII
jgi:hypothetical protein